MPPLSFVEIPADAGPFRLREYQRGFRYLTRARDYFNGLF
jgi:hypothetical protein